MNWAGSIDWNDERIAELRRLFAEGLSATEIAREMRIESRNAVIGKLTRLGLKRFAQPRPPKAPKPPRVERRATFRPKPVPASPPPKPAPARAAEPAGRHQCDLMGLTNRSCRWSVTDRPPYMFCGEPEADFANGQPYCAYHDRRAHDRSRDDLQVAA